ncbi:pentapeptide repeat-containing protein [Yersinia ruckeri]|nr:pentapeptide repeat-containing protein [Yersinia ruckeri]ELM3740989.1 pentapeptide repeat-containing protein [Yersinia ruckeri]ELM3747753.1 pentapeptide repeat-containing protein [Yersinia ruckeri]
MFYFNGLFSWLYYFHRANLDNANFTGANLNGAYRQKPFFRLKI